jgi:hypothetical protein
MMDRRGERLSSLNARLARRMNYVFARNIARCVFMADHEYP